MDFQVGLNFVTLVMCIITLIMATAALMPQITNALRLMRDGLLWVILVGFIGVVGFVGWSRLLRSRDDQVNEPRSSFVELLELTESPEMELDPLPLPTKDGQKTIIRTKPVRIVESTTVLLQPTRVHDAVIDRSQGLGLKIARELPKPKTLEKRVNSTTSPFTANRSRGRGTPSPTAVRNANRDWNR